MYKNLCAATALFTAFALPAFAQTKADDHKAHHPQGAASAPANKPAAAKPAEKAASGGMHGHMDKHCADMQKIMKIKDPKKRQKAMDEHMKKMHDEGDCPMMKDGMSGGMGAGRGMGEGASAPMEMKGDMKGGMNK